MNINDRTIYLSKDELIKLLDSNTDVSEGNGVITEILKLIVKGDKGISDGQRNWIWKKMVYILYHNDQFRDTNLGISKKGVYTLSGFRLLG
jgi:hypothetical protein